MRILFVTDAWAPQVNGVVRTMQHVIDGLRNSQIECELMTPADHRTLAMPLYPEIRLALTTPARVAARIRQSNPDHVHIVTEGPLGIMARRACLRAGRRFTTSYHTRFPEYLRARLPVPTSLSYAWLRRFHNAGEATLAATPSLARELKGYGFEQVQPWSRGVDLSLFHPSRATELDLPRPIFLSVGRVAVEKNLPAFLDLDLPGSKVVVGDGPDLERLRRAYPDVHFMGQRSGEELASFYASSDAFVFPSRTDTFGLVILEALASGLPVAAYPVTGPIDIIEGSSAGCIDDDLRNACLSALDIDRENARRHAETFCWDRCAQMFLDTIGNARRVTPDGFARQQPL
ncbi:glycosyltransferase family 4 protein [Aliihoeflea sp. PC F10.4]